FRTHMLCSSLFYLLIIYHFIMINSCINSLCLIKWHLISHTSIFRLRITLINDTANYKLIFVWDITKHALSIQGVRYCYLTILFGRETFLYWKRDVPIGRLSVSNQAYSGDSNRAKAVLTNKLMLSGIYLFSLHPGRCSIL
ncbi:hypothetical protein ACJX0J_021070, partial [Zea mays]